MNKDYKNWTDEKLRRKIRQEHDMARLATQDRDSRDAAIHAALAQAYEKELGDRS